MKIIKRERPYDILKNLENGLRNLIKTELETINHSWWKQRVPEDVRIKAKELKEKNENSSFSSSKEHDLIFYTDFMDYAKIITRNDNWNDVFKNIFGDKNLISSKLQELQPIRNSVAHSRNLTSLEERKLQLYHEEIILTIKNYKKNKIPKKPKIPWLKESQHILSISTAFDRTVYPKESIVYVQVNAPEIIASQPIEIEIYNSKKETVKKLEIDITKSQTSPNSGIYEISFKMDEKWQIDSGYYLVARHGRAEAFDSCFVDERTPFVKARGAVHAWNSDVIITVIDPDADKDSNLVEYAGDRLDSQLTISSSHGVIPFYRLRETGDSTAIFQGIIGIVGVLKNGKRFPYNLNGKLITKTQGMGIDDGFIEAERGEEVKLTYKTTSKVVESSFFISDFGAVVELNKKSYKKNEQVQITVVAPDFSDFHSQIIDEVGNKPENEIIVTTRNGMLKGYRLVETAINTGIFAGEIVLAEKSEKFQNNENAKNAFGSGPTDGVIQSSDNDEIIVSFNLFGEEQIIAKAKINDH